MTAGRVLVTGAGGFVGRAVVARLRADGFAVRAAVRRSAEVPAGVETASVGDIDAATDWRPALDGVAVVVHCAARVHRLGDDAADPPAAFRRVNRDATARLAEQAASAGAARFVFLSSIGVHGAETFGRPFTAADPPAPHSPYAVSKHEAELALRDLAGRSGLGVVVVRPPLVYGPDAPGNFSTLLRAVAGGWPLPLGSVRNRRSLVALANLVDLVACVVRHPEAPGRTLLVSDDDDLSTPELLRRTAAAMGRPARLLPVPVPVLRAAAALLGRAELARQLCGSLEVDIAETRRLLGWTPPVGVDAALADAVRSFSGRRG